MNRLFHELIQLPFDLPKFLDKMSFQKPDWMVGTAIYSLIGRDGDNWDESVGLDSIVDEGIYQDNVNYAVDIYREMKESAEMMRKKFQGDLFVYEDRRTDNRNFFIATKEEQDEIIEFLLKMGWNMKLIQINPDWDEEEVEAGERIEEGIEEAKIEAQERESMRRASYRW